MFSSAFIVLAIGIDPDITGAHDRPKRAGGIFLHLAATTTEAIAILRTGDFDLVLLGDSIPAELRHRFIAAIRRLGFSVPVVCVTATPTPFPGCSDCTCTDGVVLSLSERKPIAGAITQILTTDIGKSPARAPVARPTILPRITAA